MFRTLLSSVRLLPSDFRFQTSTQPIIARIIEPKKASLYDVLFGALGLTGVMVAGAVLAALVLAGLLFWRRSRQPFDH